MRRSKQEILDHSQRYRSAEGNRREQNKPLFSLPDLYIKRPGCKTKILKWSDCWELHIKAKFKTCFLFSAPVKTKIYLFYGDGGDTADVYLLQQKSGSVEVVVSL